ncbi:hypothetical protein EON67_09585 [archaeon]|nr:MAG: hypothetical protein EON67_09585 [archaeon]
MNVRARTRAKYYERGARPVPARPHPTHGCGVIVTGSLLLLSSTPAAQACLCNRSAACCIGGAACVCRPATQYKPQTQEAASTKQTHAVQKPHHRIVHGALLMHV